MQALFPELIVAEELPPEARFADELPRLDIHGAAIEFEREIEARAAFEGQAKHAVGNDADGERLARCFERDARKTAADATALAQTAPLTCAVLDVNLGCELVFPAAQVLKDRNIKTIFCTGYGDLHGLQTDWPNAQILAKPVHPQLLIRTVRSAHEHNDRTSIRCFA